MTPLVGTTRLLQPAAAMSWTARCWRSRLTRASSGVRWTIWKLVPARRHRAMGAELHLAHACHGGVLRRLQAEAAEEEERRALQECWAEAEQAPWSGRAPERPQRR